MTPYTQLHHPLISFGLVALQFGLITLLSYLLISQPKNPLNLNDLLWVIPAILLGLWAVKTMKLGQFNIVPDPKQNSTLITSGPYQYIRHPMYLSILLFFLPLIIHQPSIALLVTYSVLTLTLLIKLHYEEHLLIQTLNSYSHYQTHTKKLIPFLY